MLETQSGKHSFKIEVATTDAERQLGLMFRRSLPEDGGMLFLYREAQPVAMWMKNTIIPLDMVFIDAFGRVHRIETHTEPFSTDADPLGRGGAGDPGAERRHRRCDRAESGRQGHLSGPWRGPRSLGLWLKLRPSVPPPRELCKGLG